MLIIWGALLIACFMYGFVLIILSTENSVVLTDEVEVSAPEPIVGFALLGIALMSAVSGVFLPPLAVRQLKASPFVILQTTLIIRCAMFDAVAMIGLVCGVLETFPQTICFGIITAGACLVAITLPWLLSSHERITRELTNQS